VGQVLPRRHHPLISLPAFQPEMRVDAPWMCADVETSITEKGRIFKRSSDGIKLYSQKQFD
jgi:hypothetical protein